MRLALAQLNPTVGDIPSNAGALARSIRSAADAGAELFVAPELAICGYPPKDLVLQEGFVEAARAAVEQLASVAPGLTALIGAPWARSGDSSAGLSNALVALHAGSVVAVYEKRLLPTYDVFDEDRYFTAGSRPTVLPVAGLRVGLSLCEDLWRGEDVGVAARYRERADPVAELVRAGAQLIVNPSASPFALGKAGRQRDVLASHVGRHGVAIAAVNQVGGNDELVFAGGATVFVPGPSGQPPRLVSSGPSFQEALTVFDLPPDPRRWPDLPLATEAPESSEPELLWSALTLGLRDYCRKTGFKGVVLGLSGGVDSSVSACLAVAAMGAQNVLGVSMPSRHSSDHSRTDARLLADALGVRMVTEPIEGPHAAFERLLESGFSELGVGGAPGVTEENLQSRIRGALLMAFSNKLGLLLLTTGNKSELGVGYCTLYGDMNGGLGVISDLTKAQVYRLARWINAHPSRCGFAAPPIPPDVLTKPPSAELRPNQTDQDSLPPYDQVDEVIERYVTRRQSAARIAREAGLPAALVHRVVRMIDASEFKRRQAPVGLKVTDVAFGAGRRMPIAQGWCDIDWDTSAI